MLEGPVLPEGWFRLGDGLPRVEIAPRAVDDERNFAIDFRVEWMRIALKSFQDEGDLNLRGLALTLETQGMYKTDLDGGDENEALNTISSDLRLTYEATLNREDGSRLTTYYGADVHLSQEAVQ